MTREWTRQGRAKLSRKLNNVSPMRKNDNAPYAEHHLWIARDGTYLLKPCQGKMARTQFGLRSRRHPRPPPNQEGMSNVYVIGPDDGHIKIGMAVNVARRLATLQTGSPVKLKVHYRVGVPEDAVRDIERACHQQLASRKVSGEWFDVSIYEAVETVRLAVQRFLGVHHRT